MKHLLDLYPAVADRVAPPVLIALGPPWPVTQLAKAVGQADVTCLQFDVFAADRLREKLAQEGVAAEVVVAADVWDAPRKYRTVLFPAAAHSDKELKLDVIEQAYHVLEDGGRFIALSEYQKDVQFARWMKRMYGRCGESPKAKHGMAFWSEKQGDKPRQRHAVTFHAKVGDHPPMAFESWPGTFGYGRFDHGSRAMLEVADLRPGDHVLDMGCGNGAVGCLASQRTAGGKVTFIDSSARAVALTDRNARANGVTNYELVTSGTLGGIADGSVDVVLANPPYYANSEVARLFIQRGRELLKPGGRFYLTTRMPVQAIPEVVETFGDAESVENRGYTILSARA